MISCVFKQLIIHVVPVTQVRKKGVTIIADRERDRTLKDAGEKRLPRKAFQQFPSQ